MRKGERAVPWTVADVEWLKAHAGTDPLGDVCRHLRRSRSSVRNKAQSLGLSLHYYDSSLVWCDECATWREPDGDGECRVCKLRRQLEGLQAANAKAATAYERDRDEAERALREQRGAEERLTREKNRVKQDTKRIRESSGASPRKPTARG